MVNLLYAYRCAFYHIPKRGGFSFHKNFHVLLFDTFKFFRGYVRVTICQVQVMWDE